MSNDKKSVVRGVRLNLLLDKYVSIIAEYEGRTISNTIQRLLHMAIQEYFLAHENDFEFEGLMRNKISLQDLEKYITEWKNNRTEKRDKRDELFLR